MSPSALSRETPYRDVFDKYFSQVLKDPNHQEPPSGPFISISRDIGCMADPIAEGLANALNRIHDRKGISGRWKWLNKQILEESSKALKVSPSKIKYIFHSERKTMIDEIVSAMSTRYYKSDKKIRNTITGVIRSIAQSGNVIIVGRGGVAFGKDNPNSLHIKLTAPVEWRVERVRQAYGKSEHDALLYVLETDQERKFLIDSFMGYETDLSVFDLVFNRKTMKEDDIISTILHIIDRKGMISSS